MMAVLRLSRLVMFTMLAVLCAGAGAAQDYPSRPIRVIDSFPAGGNTDVLARTLGQKLFERWGQPIIVDNRPGAAGNIGAEIAARAAPDGHTLLMGLTTTLAPSMTLFPKLPYDAVRDFAPVGTVASSLLVMLVHPSLPVKSTKDLIVLARARPGELRYASSGVGGPLHLATELLKAKAGVDMVHVAYKGGAPAAAAVASGEVQLGFASLAASLPLIKAGRLRAIAVSTPKRSSALPDVPTIAESGLADFDITTWYGLLAPAGTPAVVIAKINSEVARALKLPDVAERLSLLGLEPRTGTPQEFGAILKAEIALYAKIIKDAGIKPE
ncbi:MAG TPA: tripartite tricarboxylate transporter substrate binding protein [Burkholderiales bacterium]|nr:tripartite tricarboxylate transporter substrate binding protein [Burkholderiales bacterium]